MQVKDCNPFDEIFTHIDQGGVSRHWNTTKLMQGVLSGAIPFEPRTYALDAGLAQHIATNHGLGLPNLQRAESRIDTPVLLVTFPDGEELIVDGSHRVYVRWKKGIRYVNALVVTLDAAKPYQLADLTESMELQAREWVQQSNPNSV